MDSMEKVHYDSANEDSSISVESETSVSQNGNLKEGNDLADINVGNSEVVAKGLSSMLINIIRDFDSKADGTLKSQSQLLSSLDRLTLELDQLLEDAPLPFIMQHASRISTVRKRVSSLNSLLKSIQRRVDNIDRVISMGNLQEIGNPSPARTTSSEILITSKFVGVQASERSVMEMMLQIFGACQEAETWGSDVRKRTEIFNSIFGSVSIEN